MAEEGELSDEQEVALCFNGVNGATGEYLLPPLSPHQVALFATGGPLDAREVEGLKTWWERVSQPSFAPIYGIDPDDLAQAGWGVIFAPDTTEQVKEKLSPLLELRREQAGTLYQNFPDKTAYRPGDTKESFLSRCKASVWGPVDPQKAPYYLLIVGSPEAIPFRFQYQLDVQYAVGRLHFDDPEEYARYAETVVAAEKDSFQRPREVALFGVRNRADRPTQLSADHLITPLKDYLVKEATSWNTKCFLADGATKANLRSLLGGENTPALLLSASHGMGFPSGDPHQFSCQGAILCHDWPGPLRHRGPIPEEFYFACDHVASETDLQGLVAFFFACFGGGTPQNDESAHSIVGPGMTLAPHSFVASLPKRLLGHPRGALAVVGHVDRAWGYSFLWARAGEQLAAFQSMVDALLDGRRIGFAMEPFNSRYADLSSGLSSELEDRKYRPARPEVETLAEDQTLAGMWTANNDARSYVVLGDPAVRLTARKEEG
jgi:hypothetical protein